MIRRNDDCRISPPIEKRTDWRMEWKVFARNSPGTRDGSGKVSPLTTLSTLLKEAFQLLRHRRETNERMGHNKIIVPHWQSSRWFYFGAFCDNGDVSEAMKAKKGRKVWLFDSWRITLEICGRVCRGSAVTGRAFWDRKSIQISLLVDAPPLVSISIRTFLRFPSLFGWLRSGSCARVKSK